MLIFKRLLLALDYYHVQSDQAFSIETDPQKSALWSHKNFSM